jgi:hypothetical protein
MLNNRKSARINLQDRIEVYDAQSNEFLGLMVDISTGGFKMLTKNQMGQGEEYLLSIVLPLGNSNRKIVFKADVRWCGKDNKHNSFAAGCYLVQIKAKDKFDMSALMLNELMSNDDDHTRMSEFSSQSGKV